MIPWIGTFTSRSCTTLVFAPRFVIGHIPFFNLPSSPSQSMENLKASYLDLDGVRHGDPLPSSFCLTEEVLIRGISNLVNTKQLQLIKGTRHHQIQSHSLYTYENLLFCILFHPTYRPSQISLLDMLKLLDKLLTLINQ